MREFFKTIVLSFALVLSGLSQAGLIINEVHVGDNDYFELFNYGNTDINLSGYTALIRDESESESFDLDLTGLILSANSGNKVVAERALAGEFSTGQNISWFYSRNLSLSILNEFGNTVDLWAHGTELFGATSGATFSAAPLTLLTSNSASLSYNRVSVTSNGQNFFASDWVLGNTTRGSENVNQIQVQVPEPSTLAILALGLIGLASRRFKK